MHQLDCKKFIQTAIDEIRAEVGDKKVICAFSGGVDSAVSAVLIHKAIGKNLTCILVDHGLMRKNEAAQVISVYRDQQKMNLFLVDAEARFLEKLKGIDDPETKRKIIGSEFIEVFKEESQKLDDIEYLAQGTIYPDIIESGTEKGGKLVKSHHNVGGLPAALGFKLIEPLKFLYKDQVRAVGLELGLPRELVMRQPFPGPGLGVRVIGDLTKQKLDVLRDADAVVREEIINAGLDAEIWQYFAILTNLRSVGVANETRTYGYTVAIRAILTTDAMQADWARIPYPVLEKISNRIVTECPSVNRVVYDVTTKPPATIEWE